MFLRRLSTAVPTSLRRRAAEGGVLAALRTELAQELPSSHFSPLHSQGILDFTTVSDAPRAQDVLLRGSGAAEEVLVSSLLAPLRFHGENPLPRDALMKVFIRKPGETPVLRFDCRLFGPPRVEHLAGGGAADFDVTAVCYHPFPGDAGDGKYEGPEFSSLDLQLQVALKEYLLARGINSELASLLLQHLLRKEQAQYVNWLKTLEDMFAKDD